MNQAGKIYQDIAKRTGGTVYLGIVGPVRTGKSTFIKRFMELCVLPNMENTYRRERARDELPQSGSGRTIMTAEPKFIPEEAAELRLTDSTAVHVRLIDCVGYMVPGAMGQYEDLAPRMVMTPWFDHAIPMPEAAEIGTRKVISEHATVGIVVTTDGTVTDLPREEYLEAEERVIRELQAIGKPFVVVINSTDPKSEACLSLAEEMRRRYGTNCICLNCLELGESEIDEILRQLLHEFPTQELSVYLPSWLEALGVDHPIKENICSAVKAAAAHVTHIRDIPRFLAQLNEQENISDARSTHTDLGCGKIRVDLDVPRALFYETLSHQSGLELHDDGDLMNQMTELAHIKREYQRFLPALQEVYRSGYGIVMPEAAELNLAEPEIVRQGGRFGLRMKASAPSIHLLRADIETTVSPIVGNEKQSEDIVNYLLQEFEGDTGKIWQSNLFGRSFHEIVSDDLMAKISRMPDESRKKLREALERIINEGSGGLICIIL